MVVGASGGIGQALVAAIAARGDFAAVLALSRAPPVASPPVRTGHIDLEAEDTIARAAEVVAEGPPLTLLIVASGLLHAPGIAPEKSLGALDAAALSRLFAVNAVGPMLVAKHFLPMMPRRGRAVFAALSARVGSISDNRLGGWYGYRASKAALNQMIRTLAVETTRTRPDTIVVGLHPGTVATPLSRPFRGKPAGPGIFSAGDSAGHLMGVIDRLTPADSGQLLAWDGETIPP